MISYVNENELNVKKTSISGNKLTRANRVLFNILDNDILEDEYDKWMFEYILDKIKLDKMTRKQIIHFYEANSAADLYEQDKKWIALKNLNRICSENYFNKDIVDFAMKDDKKDIEQYDYDRSFYSKLYEETSAVSHLQKILKLKNEDDLIDREKEILKIPVIKEVPEVKENVLRYKIKKFASNAIKKDLKYDDFIKFW